MAKTVSFFVFEHDTPEDRTTVQQGLTTMLGNPTLSSIAATNRIIAQGERDPASILSLVELVVHTKCSTLHDHHKKLAIRGLVQLDTHEDGIAYLCREWELLLHDGSLLTAEDIADLQNEEDGPSDEEVYSQPGYAPDNRGEHDV